MFHAMNLRLLNHRILSSKVAMALTQKIGSSQLQFDGGFAVDFRTPIPECFADALRKRQLSQGDVFYSEQDAYGKLNWSDVLGKLSYAVQIRESLTGGRVVFFEVLRPVGGRLVSNGKYKLDWDMFFERLKSGDFAMAESDAVTA
jgi:hypothetical protein